MNFLENVGFIVIVILLAIVFGYIFRNVKSRAVWKVLSVVFIVVVFTVISKSEEAYNSIFTPPTKTSTLRPAHTPRPVVPTATHEPCFRWDNITPSMDGRGVCVYGNVQALYSTDETWTRIRFSSLPNRFFIFSQLYVFPNLSVGDCIKAKGKVQLYDSIPYIETDDLEYCEPWME